MSSSSLHASTTDEFSRWISYWWRVCRAAGGWVDSGRVGWWGGRERPSRLAATVAKSWGSRLRQGQGGRTWLKLPRLLRRLALEMRYTLP